MKTITTSKESGVPTLFNDRQNVVNICNVSTIQRYIFHKANHFFFLFVNYYYLHTKYTEKNGGKKRAHCLYSIWMELAYDLNYGFNIPWREWKKNVNEKKNGWNTSIISLELQVLREHKYLSKHKKSRLKIRKSNLKSSFCRNDMHNWIGPKRIISFSIYNKFSICMLHGLFDYTVPVFFYCVLVLFDFFFASSQID